MEVQVLETQSRVRRKELIVIGIEMMIKYMKIDKIASRKNSYFRVSVLKETYKFVYFKNEEPDSHKMLKEKKRWPSTTVGETPMCRKW